MRNLKRQQRGETYDPICLSDMESDDEWITEENPTSLSEDFSWLDIQQCFNVEEGNPKLRKMREPGDLRLNRKKKANVSGKGKTKLVDFDDNEEWEDGEDSEDVQNEEIQLAEDDGDDLDEDNDDGIDFGDS
ncbi:uncharacterized protein LOC143883709 [Tasmannia lanceolata]|uniref:uncharacterized protein LOC143883709 n=1 Tax=Tasmannia lanceolata TaxID=3420 RepID=UPI00406415A6